MIETNTRKLFDPILTRRAWWDAFRQVDPDPHGQESRHVHGLGGAACSRPASGSTPLSATVRPRRGFIFGGIPLALVHRALLEFRRGDGRRAGQGPGRYPAKIAAGGEGPQIEIRRNKNSPAEIVLSGDLRMGDLVLVGGRESLFPPTARQSWAWPWVDESAITGESAPVVRESGGDRSAVTGGNARTVGLDHRQGVSPTPANRSSTG